MEGRASNSLTTRGVQQAMVYGTDPFSAQNATTTHAASIFGALPYPGSSSSVDPPLHMLVTFRFTFVNHTILNCSVVGPRNETYYHILTDAAGQASLVRNAAGRNIAVVEWRSHPTIEAEATGTRQHVGQWLRLSSDRSSRTMSHGGFRYAWVPCHPFLQLFAPGSPEWLARVSKYQGAVVLELSPRAVELGLMDVVILATVLLQSGRSID